MNNTKVKSEYSASMELQERATVAYSEEWMRPSRHVYQPRKRGWLFRLIRWIAGF